MQLNRLKGRSGKGYTTFGSIWSKGEVKTEEFCLKNENGEEVEVQSRITARWPDGSIKWSAHTALAERMGEKVELTPAESQKAIKGINIIEEKNGYSVNTGVISMYIPKPSDDFMENLAEDVRIAETRLVSRLYPVCELEHRSEKNTAQPGIGYQNNNCRIEITSVTIEETGALQCVFCYKGMYCGEAQMPFEIRLHLGAGSADIHFTHTFFYQGQEDRDFLKAMGIRCDLMLEGRPYQRLIGFGTDRERFQEAAILLNSNYPRLNPKVLQDQLNGELQFDMDDENEGEEVSAELRELIEQAAGDLPCWNKYELFQDSAYHYRILKQTKEECCKLTGLQGRRAPGSMSVFGLNGGILLGIKDFWQKYPSGMEVNGLGGSETQCTAWFYSPLAEAFDFRHYDTRTYPSSSYEGFDEMDASASGVSVTSECTMSLVSKFPSEDIRKEFEHQIQKPPVYVAAPEYYHEKRAFGFWSLPQTNTEVEQWIEHQLEKAASFYLEEVENRDWYGLFDYGDVMHTYDPVRHTWRYDMGGYAWQNTELVPTYWLWLYFLRTGREDIFTLAEAMTRHCSEVDIYHFGPKKGIGTRHNVSHWGCSCKEPRISMAGHHRFYYYLTGDYRLGQVLDDVKDADHSLKNLLGFTEENDGEIDVFARSGPDWSSFVANWMTVYERTMDETYLNKIKTGLDDIWATPMGLSSGLRFKYETADARMIYQGENNEDVNAHLQVSQGAPQVWMEAAEMLDSEEFRKLLTDLGKFYYLSAEEKESVSNGLIVGRPYSFRYFAAAVAAYSAWRAQDQELANEVWQQLLFALAGNSKVEGSLDGFMPQTYYQDDCGKVRREITWIKTNFTTQWCLNTILCLEFIREYLPETLTEMEQFLETVAEGNYHSA